MIGGVPTTIPYHRLILSSEDFIKGIVDTGFIAKHQDGGWGGVCMLKGKEKGGPSLFEEVFPHTSFFSSVCAILCLTVLCCLSDLTFFCPSSQTELSTPPPTPKAKSFLSENRKSLQKAKA